MKPAFVSGSAVNVRSSFTIMTPPNCTTAPIPSVTTMSAQPVSRRQALLAGAAMLAGVPLAALAKSGDAPKISIFGLNSASSPFTAGIKKDGKLLYEDLNPEELSIYKRIAEGSKARIVGADQSIKNKYWEDVRSRIRLEAYEFRKVQLRLNSALSKDQAQPALKTSSAFKADIEKLDQAAYQKNQEKAYKAYSAVVKDIDNWFSAVGF